MLATWNEALIEIIKNSLWLAPAAAFVGGLLTAANPCVLAMVPLMVGYVAGRENRSVFHSFLLSLVFSIGLTLMFTLFFLVTWTASSVLRADWWVYIASGVCMLMGFHLAGLLHWELPGFQVMRPSRQGFVGALLLGMLFGLVSLPCAGPILLVLLSLVPLRGAVFGATLLVAYGLGHCGLILLGGTSAGAVQKMIDSSGWNRGMKWIRQGAGVLILLAGLMILFS